MHIQSVKARVLFLVHDTGTMQGVTWILVSIVQLLEVGTFVMAGPLYSHHITRQQPFLVFSRHRAVDP